jgi:hypothetical protein
MGQVRGVSKIFLPIFHACIMIRTMGDKSFYSFQAGETMDILPMFLPIMSA